MATVDLGKKRLYEHYTEVNSTVLRMEIFCWNQKRCVDSVHQLMSKYEIIGQLHLQLTEIKGAPNLHY